jgi:hypothetical protein
MCLTILEVGFSAAFHKGEEVLSPAEAGTYVSTAAHTAMVFKEKKCLENLPSVVAVSTSVALKPMAVVDCRTRRLIVGLCW